MWEMVSAFQDEIRGFGFPMSPEELARVNASAQRAGKLELKESPGVRFLEYGKNKEGYWTYDQFVARLLVGVVNSKNRSIYHHSYTHTHTHDGAASGEAAGERGGRARRASAAGERGGLEPLYLLDVLDCIEVLHPDMQACFEV